MAADSDSDQLFQECFNFVAPSEQFKTDRSCSRCLKQGVEIQANKYCTTCAIWMCLSCISKHKEFFDEGHPLTTVEPGSTEKQTGESPLIGNVKITVRRLDKVDANGGSAAANKTSDVAKETSGTAKETSGSGKEASKGDGAPLLCSEHSSEVSHFCLEKFCSQLLCEKCRKGPHQNHSVQKIEECTQEKKQSISNSIAKTKSKRNQFTTYRKRLEEQLSEADKRRRLANEILCRKRDELIEKITQDYTAAISQNDSKSDSFRQVVNVSINSVKQEIETCDVTLMSLEHLESGYGGNFERWLATPVGGMVGPVQEPQQHDLPSFLEQLSRDEAPRTTATSTPVQEKEVDDKKDSGVKDKPSDVKHTSLSAVQKTVVDDKKDSDVKDKASDVKHTPLSDEMMARLMHIRLNADAEGRANLVVELMEMGADPDLISTLLDGAGKEDVDDNKASDAEDRARSAVKRLPLYNEMMAQILHTRLNADAEDRAQLTVQLMEMGADAEIISMLLDEDDEEKSPQTTEQASPSDENFCNKGEHNFTLAKCRICTKCVECTGYGSGCVRRGSQRTPLKDCSCGIGDAGCSKCGMCRQCASKQ